MQHVFNKSHYTNLVPTCSFWVYYDLMLIPVMSDHEAILRAMRVITPPRKIYKYKNADYLSMRRDLISFQVEFEEKATAEDFAHPRPQQGYNSYPDGVVHTIENFSINPRFQYRSRHLFVRARNFFKDGKRYGKLEA